MKRFCSECEEMLGYKIHDNAIVKICENCKKIHKNINPKKIMKKNFINNNIDNMKVLSVIYDDVLYPEIKKIMPNHTKCDSDTVSYYLDMDQMKRVYICKKCKRYWTNSQ